MATKKRSASLMRASQAEKAKTRLVASMRAAETEKAKTSSAKSMMSGDANKMSKPLMRAESSLKSETTSYKQAVGKVKKDGSVKMFKNPRKPKKY